MKTLGIMLVAPLILNTLTGCVSGKPITTINSSVPAGLSYERVESAILKNPGVNRGWVFKKESDNLITAKIVKSTHSAQVKIPFTETGYSIKYVSSYGLGEKNGRIHSTYNRWVMRLDQDIQARMGR